MTSPINAKAWVLFPKFALLSLSLQVDSGDESGFQSQCTHRSSDYCLQPRVFYFLPPELDLCFFLLLLSPGYQLTRNPVCLVPLFSIWVAVEYKLIRNNFCGPN